MRRSAAAVFILAVLLIAFSLMVTACGGGDAGTSVGETDATVQEGSGETEVSPQGGGADSASPEGESEVPEDIPVYPGAQYKGEGGSASFSGIRAEGTVEGTSYFTSDAYDTVVSWYRERLSGAKEIAGTVSGNEGQAGGVVFLLLSGEGLGAAVTVSTAEGGYGTWITIGEWKGTRVKLGD